MNNVHPDISRVYTKFTINNIDYCIIYGIICIDSNKNNEDLIRRFKETLSSDKILTLEYISNERIRNSFSEEIPDNSFYL